MTASCVTNIENTVGSAATLLYGKAGDQAGATQFKWRMASRSSASAANASLAASSASRFVASLPKAAHSSVKGPSGIQGGGGIGEGCDAASGWMEAGEEVVMPAPPA